MFIAGLSVVASLAFVLGLGALCVWALKKWGTGAMKGKQRVAVEVVQRVTLGPKTGLAVVRVGEKVMALSVGEGGVRALFELDEADRQHVLATSPVALSHVSSAEATKAIALLTPPAVPQDAVTALGTKIGTAIGTKFGGLLNQALRTPETPQSQLPQSQLPQYGLPQSPLPPVHAEVPAFLTRPQDSKDDRAFHNLLNISLSGATRIASVLALLAVASAGTLHAQAADTTKKVDPTAAMAADITKSVLQSAAQIVIPKTADAPPVVAPKGVAAPLRAPIKAPALPLPATQKATLAPKPGNGAALTPQAAATTRPTNEMQLTPAREPNNTAQGAQPAPIAADDAIMRMMPQMDVKLGGDGKTEGLRLNGTVGIVVMMGLLTLLPTLLLMMTGFTRILIVLQLLKQAMGTQSAPPAQLLAGMALLLTAFVMGPTLSEVNQKAVTPWLDGKMTQVDMLKTGVQPFRTFMLKQTRESDLKTFVEMSRLPRPATVDDVPLHVLMSAFVASELRTAFQIGFAIYLPFIIIDAVVASVLMSMGMIMLPPAMISLPFKLLLFVLVDGWSLTISSLVQSFK
ncbi:MAG: flagellar type III secretion system pore protein FliP [Gemmatimonadaceae bacterium]|nr:flagellar type III secretion system pore protein FliP [Gemmatimonadaceae bacterium]